MAVDAGASSSSPLPRFDKHHMTKSKAKAKPAAAKAKPAAAKAKAMSEKAIHSKYKAAAAGSSVSGYGTGSDGDCSLDERIASGRALPTPGEKNGPGNEVVLNIHTVVHSSATALAATGVLPSSGSSVIAEIATRPGKPTGQVCVSGFLRRAAASSLCVIICPCFGFVATR